MKICRLLGILINWEERGGGDSKAGVQVRESKGDWRLGTENAWVFYRNDNELMSAIPLKLAWVRPP